MAARDKSTDSQVQKNANQTLAAEISQIVDASKTRRTVSVVLYISVAAKSYSARFYRALERVRSEPPCLKKNPIGYPCFRYSDCLLLRRLYDPQSQRGFGPLHI